MELKNALNKSNTEVDKLYDKTGQFIDTYVALKQYLPKRIFDSVRQILYGIQTP